MPYTETPCDAGDTPTARAAAEYCLLLSHNPNELHVSYNGITSAIQWGCWLGLVR